MPGWDWYEVYVPGAEDFGGWIAESLIENILTRLVRGISKASGVAGRETGIPGSCKRQADCIFR